MEACHYLDDTRLFTPLGLHLLEQKYKTLSQKMKDNALDPCDIVKKFKGMTSPKKPNLSPSSED